MEICVREATELDRVSMWEVFRVVYAATYPCSEIGLTVPDVIKFVNGQGRRNFQIRMLSLGCDVYRARYVVAIRGGDVIGYGVAGLDPFPEIKSIDVLPGFQHRGVG